MFVECCANGCSSRSDLNPEIAFYQFPDEKERCYDWLDSIVREDLKELPVEQICNEFYVCALHFDDSYLQVGGDGAAEEGSIVEQVDTDETNKKDLKDFMEVDDATGADGMLLEDGKTQLVYVEGIGHIRLKTETDDNNHLNLHNDDHNNNNNNTIVSTEGSSNVVAGNVRLVNTGHDYMLCVLDESANETATKQTDGLLTVFDSGTEGLSGTRVKFEMEEELADKEGGADDDVSLDDSTDKALAYLCHTCGGNFEDLKGLSRHMDEQHNGCTTTTTGASADATTAATDRSFQCNECKQVFTMFDQLRTHVRNHVQSRNFSCDVCLAAFSHRSNLSRHKQQHCSAKKYQCDQCGKGFSQKSNLLTHQQTVHSGLFNMQALNSMSRPGAERVHRKPKVHECNICGKSFVSLTGLKNHGALHTGDRPFVCAMCSKSFTLMSCLKTHMATIHTGKKHFCELCGKSYQSEHYLKIHLRIHSGIKDFECESCSKRFIDLPSLKLHTRTHTGEKPFNCRVCSRSFTQQSHLKTHMRVHTGEKPYECKDCGKYFRQLSNVLEHSRTHRKPSN